MIGFSPQTTQQLGMAILIATIAAMITLSLLYVGIPFFGPVNDLLTAVISILIAGLVWQFHPVVWEKKPTLAAILLIAALLGVVLMAGNATLVAFGKMGWQLGGMYTAFGFALTGVWLIGMLLTAKGQPFLTSGLVTLGLIAGICLLFGFLAGPLMAKQITIGFQPLVWISYIAAGAGWIMFPIWCWRLAVHLK
ncbi:MAG TPA: hypothetical protein VJ965_01625 [Anaerolineales bacterium]|nr:hypothetical protein [Anaerolineales bacterium]